MECLAKVRCLTEDMEKPKERWETKNKVLGQVESNSCKSQKVVTYLLLLLFS